jgi:molybdate transport system substrate-binding protein
MRNFLSPVFIAAALIGLARPANALPSVNVMADSNLNVAISHIARSYSSEKNIVVNSSYADVATQEAQIIDGAAADILITPKASLIEDLKTRGVIDVYSQIPIARDMLVLAGPQDSPLNVDLEKEFPIAAILKQIAEEPLFIVASPEFLPEGGFSKEALRAVHAAGFMEPYTLYLKDRNQMFEMIADKGAYGVVLSSSALRRKNIRVLGTFHAHTHQPIQYYAVVIAGENMDAARGFLAYLQSPAAKIIFRKNGFQTD